MVFESFPQFAYAAPIATFLWSLLIGVVAHFAVFRLRAFDGLAKFPLVPPFIALPATMFAFMMAFMASDAWQNIGQARAALIAESAAVARVAAVPVRPVAAQRQSQAVLRQYLDAAIDEEWKAQFNLRGSARAEAAIARLEAGIWSANGLCEAQPARGTACSDALITATYVKAIDDLRTARHQRLSLGFQGTLVLKWALAIGLALVTAISIAAVHRTSQRTAAIGQVLFCLATWMAFTMVATHIQPYRGPDALSPVPLQELRAVL